MKHLVESIVNESKFPEIDCIALMDCMDGTWDFELEYDGDPKDMEYLNAHSKYLRPEGGYDGNGMSAIEALEEEGVKLKNIDKDYEDQDIYDTLPEGEIDNPKILKEFGRVLGINAKAGLILYCAGYESPFVMLFDEKNAKVKDYMKKIEPFS